MRATATIANNPALKGKRASRARFLGPFKRFAVYAMHTRFEAVAWVVCDAEAVCEAGLPEITIHNTEAEAIAYAERRAAEAEAAEPAID